MFKKVVKSEITKQIITSAISLGTSMFVYDALDTVPLTASNKVARTFEVIGKLVVAAYIGSKLGKYTDERYDEIVKSIIETVDAMTIDEEEIGIDEEVEVEA